jgi:hypothetical protein
MKGIFQCWVSTSVYEMGGVNSITKKPSGKTALRSAAAEKRHESRKNRTDQWKKNAF